MDKNPDTKSELQDSKMFLQFLIWLWKVVCEGKPAPNAEFQDPKILQFSVQELLIF